MAQAGLHAYLGLKSKKWIPNKKYFISFLMGSIIPDIDIIFYTFASYYIPIEKAIIYFHRTFTHSLITIATIYLLFLVLYELTKKEYILDAAYGFMAGFIFHLLIDLFFWFDSIDLFWPLPIPEINIWFFIDINQKIKYLIMAMEFIFFRFIAYQLIEKVIIKPLNNGAYVNYLNLWMKSQTYSLLIFIITIISIPQYTVTMFGILYIPSIIALIFFFWKLRGSLS